MRVVILGSGVVGVASAWYLNQAGHEVTVIDREPGAALETSAANAGQISRICCTVGGTRCAFKSDQMDVPAPCAAGGSSRRYAVSVEMDVANVT